MTDKPKDRAAELAEICVRNIKAQEGWASDKEHSDYGVALAIKGNLFDDIPKLLEMLAELQQEAQEREAAWVEEVKALLVLARIDMTRFVDDANYEAVDSVIAKTQKHFSNLIPNATKILQERDERVIEKYKDANSLGCEGCGIRLIAYDTTDESQTGLSSPEGDDFPVCGHCFQKDAEQDERVRDAGSCPGDPIIEVGCPVCGNTLKIEHGDDEGDVSILAHNETGFETEPTKECERNAALDEAAKVMCGDCALGRVAYPQEPNWLHRMGSDDQGEEFFVRCKASAIHKLKTGDKNET